MAPITPINAEAFREFEHTGWEVSVAAYDKYFGSLTRQTINPLLDGVKIKSGMHILDVATGPGYVAAAAKQRGTLVTAIDFSEQMIARAIRQNQDPSITFQVGDAEALSFADETFDAVVMNFGVLHLARPEKSFEEAHRVLKKGGTFGFTAWAVPEEAQGFAIILRAIEIFGNPNVSLPAGPPFFRFSDPAECKTSLEKAGFTAVACMKLPMTWQLNSTDELFKAFHEGTGRTGGLLRAQSPSAILAIEEEVKKQCNKYLKDDKLSIPMPANITIAQKL